MKKYKYTYHFCAMYQGEYNILSYRDGLLGFDVKPCFEDSYLKIKKDIDPVNFDKLIVLSFTLINGSDN